ncbi:MAG: ATP-binding protein [Candidatus Dormibacteria bacterium]
MKPPIVGAYRRLLPASSPGLGWPRRDRDRDELGGEERERLLQYERLMGLAHVVALTLATVAVLVHVEFIPGVATPWFVALLAGALAFATVYHLVLPRWWCSRRKVVLGLGVDVVLASAVVHLTGDHMSLLVFLYYLIVAATALTLGTGAVYAVCAAISVAFCALLPFDLAFRTAATAHLGHVSLFLVSVWLVGAISATAAAQLQASERRLLRSLRSQQEIAEERAQLSRDLREQLAESRRLLGSLEGQRLETQRLADMVIRAQEDERGRLARELHDEANQLMAALLTTVDVAESIGARYGHDDLVGALGRLRRLAGNALSDLQRIATELRPPALDEFGLVPALQRHVRDRTRESGVDADFAVEGRRRRVAASVEVALYRIAQEALANVLRHAAARTVHLRLRFLADEVRLDISDDGAGFDCTAAGSGAAERAGLGLAGMRERAGIVGGRLEVSSRPGGGTRVSARVPSLGVPALELAG